MGLQTYLNVNTIQNRSIEDIKLKTQFPDPKCNIFYVKNILPGTLLDKDFVKFLDNKLYIRDKDYIGGTLNNDLINALISTYDSEAEANDAIFNSILRMTDMKFLVAVPFLDNNTFYSSFGGIVELKFDEKSVINYGINNNDLTVVTLFKISEDYLYQYIINKDSYEFVIKCNTN